MPRTVLALLPLAALLAASCQKPAAPADAVPVATPAASPPASAAETEVAPAPADAGITMRYACEQGHSVAIIGGEIARVSLADGRVVEIPRVAGSAPPRYSGVALSFEVGSDGATLGQHEVGGFACREAH